MKKLLKKIKPFLKRSAAWLGVVMVLLCSFVTPISAVDISDSMSAGVMRPLFDYDYLVLYYSGGYKATFNLKDVFFANYLSGAELTYTLTDNETGTRSITFTLEDLTFSQVQISLDGQFVQLPYWALSFSIPITGVDRIGIGCSESIYDYNLLKTAYNIYKDSFYFEGTTSGSDSYSVSNTSSFYYPVFSYGTNGNITGRSLSSKDLSFTSSSAVGTFPISPFSNLNSLLDLMPSGTLRQLLYFSKFDTIISPPISDSMVFNIFYVPESSVVSFREYHDLYFPAYNVDVPAVDFTGWITTSLGGFFGFEFIPGVSIGTVFTFCFGVGCIFSVLKMFAGG